jgi:Endonuclease-reverse transcriptase
VQLDFIHFLKNNADIVCIQEPYLDEPYLDHNNLSRALAGWIPVYPSNHYNEAPVSHAITFVKCTANPNTWHQIAIPSPDILAICIDFGTLIDIFNIYMDCEKALSFGLLKATLCSCKSLTSNSRPSHTICLGDLNSHHPMWDEDRNTHLFTRPNLDRAQQLINLITSHDPIQMLTKDVPTLQALGMGMPRQCLHFTVLGPASHVLHDGP